MARFYGPVGYGLDKDMGGSVFVTDVQEVNYYGDVRRNARRLDSGEYLNDNLIANVIVSIVADDFAIENFQYIRYVLWNGTRWKVTMIDVQWPRLILTIGGIYNGPTPKA